jgi:predicted CopG family antitoxin
MKSITIDIADNVYNRLREFLDTLPSESIKVYEEDFDFLTADEKDEIYNIQEKTKNGDFSDFEDWDSMKKNSGNV